MSDEQEARLIGNGKFTINMVPATDETPEGYGRISPCEFCGTLAVPHLKGSSFYGAWECGTGYYVPQVSSANNGTRHIYFDTAVLVQSDTCKERAAKQAAG